MFKTAYETLPCRMYKMDEVYKNIQLALAGRDVALVDNTPVQFATGQTNAEVTVRGIMVIDGAVNIPIFAHPVALEEPSGANSKHWVVATDARDVTKRSFDSSWKVTTQSEYNMIRTRLILQTRWLTNIISGATSAPIQNFPMRIYSRWMADAMARRFNLDLDSAVRVQALAAFMYLSMHHEMKEIKDYELPDIAMKIGRGVNIPVNIVAEVIEGISYFDNVEEFCDNLITRIPSSRLEGLNPVVLYGIVKGSWFGKNASELVSVSIEHPPTFEALLYAAAGSSALQRTILGTLVKAELRDREALAFIEKINHATINKE